MTIEKTAAAGNFSQISSRAPAFHVETASLISAPLYDAEAP